MVHNLALYRLRSGTVQLIMVTPFQRDDPNIVLLPSR
jgi:hypothetical protein